ncbi:MAG: hypothetical protein WD733_04945 [Bryobacterales bacterium]
MPKGADKFELTLSLQEVVALFIVMVALFTGLLFFGYRVGNAHNKSAVDRPATPVAPAQETPGRKEMPAGVELEPEIRLENVAPEKLDDLHPAPARMDSPGANSSRPLAQLAGEGVERPCKADHYWSFLRAAVPSKHRFFERLADWAGVPPAGDEQQPTLQSSAESEAGSFVSESAFSQNSSHDSEAPGCGPPVSHRGERSVAC